MTAAYTVLFHSGVCVVFTAWLCAQPEGCCTLDCPTLCNCCVLKVLREGLGDHTRPVSSSRVTVRVKGKLQDGSVVEENESLSFFVGEGEVIQGVCGVGGDIREGSQVHQTKHLSLI